MTMSRTRTSESGFTLAAAIVLMTILLVFIAYTVPRAWSQIMARERDQQTLFAMKQAGDLRYVGITTSEGRRHREFEEVMRTQALDFVQVTYNIVDREVEDRILPLARERGFGVNPWRTHSRFLVSHNLLIDPTYADPMREWLGPLLPGSLLLYFC